MISESEMNKLAEEDESNDCTPDEVLSKLGKSNRFLISCIFICGLTSTATSMNSMSAAFVTQSCTNCSNMISIVDEFDLRDEKAYLSDLTTTGFMLGNMVGGVILTHAADRYGRRPVLILCLCLISITGFIGALCSSFNHFAVVRFIQGVFHTGGALGGWVLGYEYTSLELRFYTTVWFGMSWVIGYCLVTPLAYFSTSWRWLIVMVSSPQICVAAWCYFFVPESLHFLVATGRREKHISKWLRKAHRNQSESILTSTQRIVSTRTEAEDSVSLFHEVCSQPRFVLYTLVLVFLWICDTFIYFGLSLYSTHLAGNIYLNYFLMGLVEVPAYIVSPWAMNRFGRRATVSVTHLCASAFFVILIFTPADTAGTTCFWLAGKFAISTAYMSIYVFASEVFPTNIRNLSMGFCETMSRFGAILSPFLATLSRFSVHLPMIILSVLSLLASILCYILPETLNRRLPSNVREAISS